MKLRNAKITMLVGEDGTTIQLIDGDSSNTFAEVKLTPVQLSQMLSRLSHTKCEIEVFGLDKVGKKMIHKMHEFEITGLEFPFHERASFLSEKIKETLPDGWVPDNYFGSQNTFFEKDGKQYARTTIRRWIDIVD